MLIPYALPLISRINEITNFGNLKLPVSWGTVIINCVLVLMAVLIFVENVCKKLRRSPSLWRILPLLQKTYRYPIYPEECTQYLLTFPEQDFPDSDHRKCHSLNEIRQNNKVPKII